MLYFANKHPGVLVLVCLVNFVHNYLISMTYVIAIIVLADVMPNGVADVMPLIFGRWKATVVNVTT